MPLENLQSRFTKLYKARSRPFYINADKVGPRKKFKCSTPSCENVGMLSSAAGDHSGLWSEKNAHLSFPTQVTLRKEVGAWISSWNYTAILPLWDRWRLIVVLEILNDIFQVQFRADPVLYKDNLPAAMKKFNDMGSLWYLAKWMVVMIKKSQTIHFRKIKWLCYR